MLRNVFFIKSLIRLPTPPNISYFWNFSSTISVFLVIQIMTGIFLTMHYTPHITYAFDSIIHIINDVPSSIFIRYMHCNSASFFMMLIYLHLFRGIYYKRFSNFKAWNVSVILMLLSMSVAFLSYVLPWSQMSYWGATVITNLVSAAPFVSSQIVIWLWGGFSVDLPTLNRFYTLHFILPLMIASLSVFHLIMIHEKGSSNPLGFFSSFKIDFWPWFSVKDMYSFFLIVSVFFFFVFFLPEMFSDPDNFIKANSLVTPPHIKPEWYFLFAYAMLRCIPNKLLSVLVLLFSILVFLLLPLYTQKLKISFFYQMIFFVWITNLFLLTWLGGLPVKDIFTYMSQVSGILYFFFIFLLPFFYFTYFMKMKLFFEKK